MERSTRETTAFVLGVLEFSMCGEISDPGGHLYPPRVRRNSTRPTIKRSASGIGVSARCGAVSTRGTAVYVPGSSGLQMYGRMDDRGMAPYPPQRLVFLHRPGLCRPGVSLDPGCHCLNPPFVRVVDVWKDALFGNGRLSSLARVGFTCPNRSAMSHWGWGFTLRGAVSTWATTIPVLGVF